MSNSFAPRAGWVKCEEAALGTNNVFWANINNFCEVPKKGH